MSGTHEHQATVFQEVSDPPWNLSFTVERVGSDHVCHILGGKEHVGSIALSEWRADRPVTRSLTVARHKEEEIAVHTAHRLCSASRTSVAVIAGIHFPALSGREIADIVSTVKDLAIRGARALRDCRIRENLWAESGLLARLREGVPDVLTALDAFTGGEFDWAIGSAGRFGSGSPVPPRKVRVFAPLYLSSACTNDCAYCGFRRSARFRSRTLTIEEAVAEAGQLARQGYRTIDLVTGEISADPFIDSVCRTTEALLARTAISHINLNLGALSTAQLARLHSAGATGYHLYQETYDPESYFRAHRGGLKRDMANRLEGLHRAIDAGFPRVGLGILLGLHPWREDLASLVRHAEILLNDHPGIRLGFSLPRIQFVDADLEAHPYPVNDTSFLQAMLYLRRRFPDADLTVTTREKPELRDTLLRLGVSKVSAGVSTAPGGYLEPNQKDTPQFPVSDKRSLAAIVEVIEKAGRTAVFE